MAFDTGRGVLPPLYERWMNAFLGGPIPEEGRATCHRCAMCAGSGKEARFGIYYFDPYVKCCSWIPTLPNFLVGRILSDTDPTTQPGRASVEHRILDAIGVKPLGLTQPPIFSLLYDNSDRAFGRSHTLRCPHYIEDVGGCGIWRNRNSTCATWFCKHDRGALARKFWRDSLYRLLRVIEEDLACWCVLELRLGSDELRHLLASADWRSATDELTGEILDNRVDREAYARLWADWRGREGEFFSRCAELVNPLSWTDVLAICGPEARAYAQLTEHAYQRLISDDLPTNLQVGFMQVAQIQKGMTRISTYSNYDPIDIPEVVMELLHYFDGRPTADALAAIAEEKRVRLDPALVCKLVDFEVLVAPNRADSISCI